MKKKKTKITRRGILLIFLFALLWFGLSLIGTIFTGNIIVSAVLGFALPVIASAGTKIGTDLIHGVFKPEINEDDETDGTLENCCRIAVYGRSGSGKTTLIRKLLSSSDIEPRQEPSTEKFKIRSRKIMLELDEPEYPVAFADYQGQAMGDIVTDAPPNFFGEKGERVINAIFFIVDLFPDLPDERKKPQEFKKFLRSYKQDALTKIEERVRKNQNYVNEDSIEPVFRVCRSEIPPKHLFAVRFLINKIDILDRIISEYTSYTDEIKSSSEYALKLYEPQIEAVKNACEDNHVSDFSVRVISAKYDSETLTGLLTEIARTHKERYTK
jgi:GTPase SAR1 family protein